MQYLIHRYKPLLFVLLAGLLFYRGSLQGFELRTDQLDYLTEVREVKGDSLAILHIYSDYPGYAYVDATGEGIACVDDAARGIVAYLKHYKHTGREKSLRLVKHLLSFLFYMQADDGGFYNFIWEDYSRNTDGETSHNRGITWWTARAIWAMGYLRYESGNLRIEPERLDSLDRSMARALEKLLQQDWTPDQWQMKYDFKIPERNWLADGWANMSSELALGLIYYASATGDDEVDSLARMLCDGLAAFQIGDRSNYPFGLHPDGTRNIHRWHAWGARGTQTLALASRLLQDPNPSWLDAARNTADNLYTHMLLTKRISLIESIPAEASQINYDMAPVINGLAELHRTTGDEIYATRAGLYATWWFGDNPRGVKMYDEENGRFYDGVSPGRWNRNSGGETNTEGLMALTDLKLLGVDSLAESRETGFHPVLRQELEEFQLINGHPDTVRQNYYGDAQISGGVFLRLSPEDTLRGVLNPELNNNDMADYRIFLHLLRKPSGSNSPSLNIRINGELIAELSSAEFATKGESYFWLVPSGKKFRWEENANEIEIICKGDSGTIAADIIRYQPVVERKTWVTTEGDTLYLERSLE